VHDDELAVGRELHVELDTIDIEGDSLFERFECVLGSVGAVASVSDDDVLKGGGQRSGQRSEV